MQHKKSLSVVLCVFNRWCHNFLTYCQYCTPFQRSTILAIGKKVVAPSVKYKSQIFPTIDSLPASGLTPRTLRLDRFFWTSAFFVFSFFITLFFFRSVRNIKLATRQLLGARKYSPSYRIVSYRNRSIKSAGAGFRLAGSIFRPTGRIGAGSDCTQFVR